MHCGEQTKRFELEWVYSFIDIIITICDSCVDTNAKRQAINWWFEFHTRALCHHCFFIIIINNIIPYRLPFNEMTNLSFHFPWSKMIIMKLLCYWFDYYIVAQVRSTFWLFFFFFFCFFVSSILIIIAIETETMFQCLFIVFFLCCVPVV